MHHSEVVLTASVPLVGGELIQPHCLGVVLRDPGAIREVHTEVHSPQYSWPHSEHMPLRP